MARFRSDSDPEKVYETKLEVGKDGLIVECTCPGFEHRGMCSHVDQLRRWDEWQMPVPEGILEPPPPTGTWKREVI